ncbi:hypothetical protein HGRIS_007094 [Hohenbuehelia grisea]|uniref:Rhodanese domain-containing protein n=1 Tax=Hohenbuehelia grisea TaxID=104357 RepID=A0ABR3JBJ7_9AGAR
MLDSSKPPSSLASSSRGSSEQRTLADVLTQVAQEFAVRAITKSETVDGVSVGVSFTLSQQDGEQFLRIVAAKVERELALKEYLFAFATARKTSNSLILCGSSDELVGRAVLLTSSKFLGRIESVSSDAEGTLWAAAVRDLGVTSLSYDETALWDVVRKSARQAIDPLLPPPGSRSIAQILEDTRAKLQRITPQQAYDELQSPEVDAPTFLVDIRPAAQRAAEGGIHGSLIIERNVLEWRLDPRSDARLSIVDRYDLRVIVFCQEGYTSSLAAYALQDIGLLNATDIIGGYQGWKDAGLPVDIADPPLLLAEST